MKQGMYKVPIKQLNLCVTGETNILTKEYGNIPIGPLVESGVTTATCWNGKEWSETVLARTDDGNGDNYITVSLSNGHYVRATQLHKWYVYDENGNEIEKRTSELTFGDVIIDYSLPRYGKDAYKEIRNLRVTNVSELSKSKVPTYCGNEPKEHKLIFNGILTGNCLEITQPNFPLYDMVNIRRNIKFKDDITANAYYQLRTEAYHHQDSSKIEYYQQELRKLYEFVHDDINAPVDETVSYDYFDLHGNINLGEVGVCIIAGINLGFVPEDELGMVSEYLVRFEDQLIDYMDYDTTFIEKAAKMRRGVGIGFSDVFHLLAKENVKYNTREGRQLLHDRVELAAYHM